MRQYYALTEASRLFPASQRVLRVLLLADDRHPANVVQEHIQSFVSDSCHTITIVNSRYVTSPWHLALGEFDAVLIHYSVFIIADTYLSEQWQQFLRGFSGVVAVIQEDEYQSIEAFRNKFDELGVKAVFSCLDSPQTMERVYGSDTLLRDTLFFCCLPGYVSPALREMPSPPPMRDRKLHVVYRGRDLSPDLGRFAQEKRLIGEQMAGFAQEHGLSVDISSNEDDRIYGPQWPEFLQSGKAMLGVEGGASIFDFDGSIRSGVEAYRQAHPQASFEQIWDAVLAGHEGNIDFRTITPKIFEAIALKTALVLYPGRYSGILQPGRHYIVLERDGSNIASVVARLKDDVFLQDMADRTRQEVLLRPELASAFYVRQIDRVLDGLAPAHGAASVVETLRSGLALARTEHGNTQQLLSSSEAALLQCRQAHAASVAVLEQTRQSHALAVAELERERDRWLQAHGAVSTRLQHLQSETENAGAIARLFVKRLLA